MAWGVERVCVCVCVCVSLKDGESERRRMIRVLQSLSFLSSYIMCACVCVCVCVCVWLCFFVWSVVSLGRLGSAVCFVLIVFYVKEPEGHCNASHSQVLTPLGASVS